MAKTILGMTFLSLIGVSTLVEVIQFQRPKDNNRACVYIDGKIHKNISYSIDKCDSLPMFVFSKDSIK